MRPHRLSRTLLGRLDLVEEHLYAEEEADPLQAARSTVVGPWKILGVLGKGPTARALLAERTVDDPGEGADRKVLPD